MKRTKTLCDDISSILVSANVPQIINSNNLFWNLEDPVLSKTLRYKWKVI